MLARRPMGLKLRLLTRSASGPAQPRISGDFEAARVAFEAGWTTLLPNIPESAFAEWRHDRAWRAEAAAMRARGEKLLGAAATFGIVRASTRIVPLSSILAELTAIVLVRTFEHPLPYRLLVIAGALYVVIRHRANIQRLLAGTEPCVGQSSPEMKAEPQA